MENFEERSYRITDEEKEKLSPEKLAELEERIGKANALSREEQREKAIRETEEGIEEGLK